MQISEKFMFISVAKKREEKCMFMLDFVRMSPQETNTTWALAMKDF